MIWLPGRPTSRTTMGKNDPWLTSLTSHLATSNWQKMRRSPDGEDTRNFYLGITMNQEMTPMYPHLVLLIHHSIHEERRSRGGPRLVWLPPRPEGARPAISSV